MSSSTILFKIGSGFDACSFKILVLCDQLDHGLPREATRCVLSMLNFDSGISQVDFFNTCQGNFSVFSHNGD